MTPSSNDKYPRIALVSGCLNLGGSTTFLCNLAGELVRRNLPVQVYSLEKNNPLEGDFKRLNIPLTITHQGKRIYEDRIQACVEGLRLFQPNLVVGCLAPPSFEVLRYLPKGIQRAGMVQSDDPVVYSTLVDYRDYLDTVVGVSQTIATRLNKMEVFSGKQVACIPYGVPMPEHLSNSITDQPLRILYLGRLFDEQKRVRLFPEIFQHLCKSGIPFCWTLAGEGSERAYLESKMVGGRADQKVEFLGQVDYQNVPLLLENQDIILLTSDYEGLPLSLLEAMAQGVVPVVSDLESGISEVVNSGNGSLVPIDDTEGYAKALIHLHKNRAELAHKRICARLTTFPAYSISAMADRWIQLANASTIQPFQWEKEIKIRPPIGRQNHWHYSTIGKMLRRIRTQYIHLLE